MIRPVEGAVAAARKVIRTVTGTEAHDRAMAQLKSSRGRFASQTGWHPTERWSWADRIS